MIYTCSLLKPDWEESSWHGKYEADTAIEAATIYANKGESSAASKYFLSGGKGIIVVNPQRENFGGSSTRYRPLYKTELFEMELVDGAVVCYRMEISY